ncbi:MAG: hypothetical protein CMK09_05595 [Ponticaulis sp.]|nr:hypothetical protein [Ponticaulis sp.]|tara:strand:- start:21698 stop:23683 length:1986 start_codon:yes stop_codon:yes gene_type:complete
MMSEKMNSAVSYRKPVAAASSFKNSHIMYRPDIDGLRMLAVLSVIVHHAFPRLMPGGFVGVDIFFVISGYLITSIIKKEVEAQNYSIINFYKRRINRIFPALLLTFTVATIAALLLLFTTELEQFGQHLVSSVFFFQNIQLWSEANYFDTSSHFKPLLHLWSLSVEEQFYVIWPILLFFALKSKLPSLVLCAIILVASLTYSITASYSDPTAAYYSTLSRSWELVAGGLIPFLSVERLQKSIPLSLTLSGSGCFLILASFILIDPDTPFPGWPAIAPVLGTALCIISGPENVISQRFLSNRCSVYIGLISYPLYLWHWVYLSFAFIVFKNPSNILTAIFVAASFLSAIATFEFVEKPLRKISSTSVKAVVLLGCMVTVALFGFLLWTGKLLPRHHDVIMPEGSEWDALIGLNVTELNPNMSAVYELSSDRSQLTLFLGDSQLAQYAPRLIEVTETTPSANGVIMAIGGGCPPMSNVKSRDVRRKECDEIRNLGWEWANDPRVNKVVLGGAWSLYSRGSQPYYYQDSQQTYSAFDTQLIDLYLANLRADIENLQNLNKQVFLVIGTPGYGQSWDVWQNRISGNYQNLPEYRNAPPVRAEFIEKVVELARDLEVILVDPATTLCDSSGCRTHTDSGLPIYTDGGHFNPAWVRLHSDFLDKFIE